MDAETQNGFTIDGKIYQVPDVSGLRMGERRLLWERTGFVQEEFVRDDDETEDEHAARIVKMVRHPGYIETLMLVAYLRGNEGVKIADAEKVVDSAVFTDAMETYHGEPDALPPASTSEPDEPSQIASNGSLKDSGNDSSTASETPASILPLTTTGR